MAGLLPRLSWRNHLLTALAASCALSAIHTRSVAQASFESPDSSLVRALAGIDGTPLSLEEARASARANATSLREAEAALAAARGALRSARGRFDPELFGEFVRSSDESPTATPFAGASVLETEAATGSAGARIRLPLGTELEVSLDATRTSTNSTFSALDPQYDAGGRISLVQPLLAGFGPAAGGDLGAARNLYEAAEESYEDARLALEANLEWTYWDLYAAERDYAVAQLILERARSFLSEAELRARAGLVGPSEVANARVFVAEQEQALLDREERLDGISDALASLIGRRPGAGMFRFRPVDSPPEIPGEVSGDRLVEVAFEQNHAIRALRESVEALRARHAAARWNALPQLDLFGSIGGNGLVGTPRDVIFGSDTLRTRISGDLGDALSQASSRDYGTWSAGVRVTLPITFRERGGERDRLEAEIARLEQATIAAERSLEERVRASHREMSNNLRRLEAAQAGVDASQEQVRIGVIEYRNGRTTAFELVRLGADFAAAQQRYSQALVRAAKAAAEIRYLTSGAYPGAI